MSSSPTAADHPGNTWPGTTTRRWLLPALVVLAALVAHGGCLGSTFYLDDWTQVVENDSVDRGQWWTAGARALTYLTYWLTYRFFGMSAPAFHAGNLLLHAGVALAVFGFAREFFEEAAGLSPERARRIAFWAGVLFAVHPLCSEVPNYTRARDIEFVSLFAVLTARATLRWRRYGGWRCLLAAASAILAATFSKEVGVVVAGGTAVIVAFGVGSAEARQWTWPRFRQLASPVSLAFWLLGLSLLVVWLSLSASVRAFLSPLAHTVWNSLHDFRLRWHLLTQARVFWMYAWRVVLPVRLCSDHQIAWTISYADRVAWLAVVGLVGLLAGTAGLWVRRSTRPLAVLLALTLLAILHRLGDVSAELMVEYRVYPAMAFLCPALAWALDRLPARTVLLTCGVVALAGLSILRTRDWRSPETLAANVVAQYPLQARARQEVQEADVRAGRWEAVVAREDGILHALDGIEIYGRSQKLRLYDPGLATLTRVAAEGNKAEGLARSGQASAAFEYLGQLRQGMRRNHLTDPIYWTMYYFAYGKVDEAVGQREDALVDFRKSRDLSPYLNIARRKLQALGDEEKK